MNRDPEGYRSTVPIADNGSRQSEFLYALNSISKSLHKNGNFSYRIRSVVDLGSGFLLSFSMVNLEDFYFIKLLYVYDLLVVYYLKIYGAISAHSPDSFYGSFIYSSLNR